MLGRGDVAYGLILSIWTVGMAVGALLLSARVAVGAAAATGLAAVAVQGTGLALPALWPSFAFFLACSFMGGLAHGLKNVMFRTLIHVRVPGRLHGRVFAAYNGIRNSAEVGAFAAGGLLVTAIGPRGTLAYAGGLSTLAGLLGLLVLLRMYSGWIPSGPIGRSADAASGAQSYPGRRSRRHGWRRAPVRPSPPDTRLASPAGRSRKRADATAEGPSRSRRLQDDLTATRQEAPRAHHRGETGPFGTTESMGAVPGQQKTPGLPGAFANSGGRI